MAKPVKNEEIPSRDVALESPVAQLRVMLPEGWEPHVRDGYDDEWVADAPDHSATVYIKLDPTDGVRRSCGFVGDNRGLMLELARRSMAHAQESGNRAVEVHRKDLGRAVHSETTCIAPDGDSESIFFVWGRFLDMADAGVRSLRITLAADPELPTLPALRNLFERQADRLAGQINGDGWLGRDDVACRTVEFGCNSGPCTFLLPLDWSVEEGRDLMWICTSPGGSEVAEVDSSFISHVAEDDSGDRLAGSGLIQAMASRAVAFMRTQDLDGDVAVADRGDRVVVHGAFRAAKDNPEYVRRWYAFCLVKERCLLFRVTYACPLAVAHSARSLALHDFYGGQVDALDFGSGNARPQHAGTAAPDAPLPPLEPGWQRLPAETEAYAFSQAMPQAWMWSRRNENSWLAEAPDGNSEITVTVELVDEVDDTDASVRRLTNAMVDLVKKKHGEVPCRIWRSPGQALVAASFDGDNGANIMHYSVWAMLLGRPDRREVHMRHEVLRLPQGSDENTEGRALIAGFRRQLAGFIPGLSDDF